MTMDGPTTVTAALALGAAGSVHCFVMCGPLACAAQLDRGSRRIRGLAAAYQAARVVSYATVGALLGALGHITRLPLSAAVPWVMALVLLVAALDPGGKRLRRLPPLPGIAQLLRAIAALHARLAPITRAVVMGAVTPLLPCGLLYGVATAAVATGHATSGALVMGGFALGALPALVAAQLSARFVGRLRRGRWSLALVERGVPLLAAAVVVWRALAMATAARTGAPPHCH